MNNRSLVLFALLLLKLPLYSASPNINLQEPMIYIMPEYEGAYVLEQCMRTNYQAETYWRVTSRQVEALETLLTREIQRLQKSNSQ